MKKDWEVKRLGDVGKVIYGYTEKASFEEIGPKFLRITDIQDECVDWDRVPFCKINDSDFDKYKLNSGDIVFARTGATTGKSYLVNNPPESVFASYLIKVHINHKQLSPNYLFLFFQTKTYWDNINQGISGAAQGGFNATKLSALPIPIPPLPEQQRIVAILDEAFEAIAKVKANAEQNLKNSKAIFEGYLQSVFENKGDGWEDKKLEDVCVLISKGSSPKWQGIKYVDEPCVLFITSENVGENTLILKERKYVEEKFNLKESKSILKQGDVLTNIVGASIGRTAIFTLNDIANINQAVCLIRCNQNFLFNEYLMYLLNSPFIKQHLHDNEVNTARANLSLGFFRNLVIPLPTIAIQQSVVSSIKKIHLETKQLEANYQQNLNNLEELKKSLLQKAFNGELSTEIGL